jgi:uncharacterized delta-60 repeat protein
LQADGNIIAAGDFTTFNNVGRPRITRLLPNGQLDLDINFGTGANATIASTVVQYDRKIVIGGDFTEVNGFPRNRFARLFGGSVVGAGRIEFFLSDYQVEESAGAATLIVKRSGGTESTATVDYFSQPETATPGADYTDVSGTLTFGPGESVREIVVPILDDNIAEPVETVLVTLTNVVGAAIGRQPIARVQIISDDAVFSFSQPEFFVNEGIAGGLATIKVIREGDLSFPVTVTVTSANGTATSPADYIAGTNQIVFTPGESAKTVSIPIIDDNLGEGDETVLLHLTTSGGSALPGLANATLIIEDNDFHPGFLTFTNATALVSETNGLVNFEIRRTSGSQGPATVMVDTQSGTATEGVDYIGFHGTVSFADGQVSALVPVQIIDDTLVEATETFTINLSSATGGALGSNPILTVGIADNDLGPGSLDTTFDPGAGSDGPIYSMALQPDGKIAIGGEFANYDGTNATRVARVTAQGHLDPNFSVGEGPSATVYSVALTDQGALTIGGAFRTFDSQDFLYLARVTTNGFLDASMSGSAGLNAPVLALSRQADSKMLVGGQFTSPSSHLGRILVSGQFDVSFNPAPGADDAVLDLGQTTDGKIIVGGQFTHVGGQPRGHVARVLADGRIDLSFDTSIGADNTVRAALPLADGSVLIGGDFTHVNGLPASYLARLNSDGSLDTTFGSGAPDGPVYALAIYPNGRIVAVGSFTTAGGQPRKGLVRLDSSGALDSAFDVAINIDGPVYDVAIQPDGKILIAGAFAHVNGFPRMNIARLNGARDIVITSVAISGTDLVITFDTEIGVNYDIQATSDLGNPGSWTTIGTVSSSGASTQATIPMSAGYQFFRLKPSAQ